MRSLSDRASKRAIGANRTSIETRKAGTRKREKKKNSLSDRAARNASSFQALLFDLFFVLFFLLPGSFLVGEGSLSLALVTQQHRHSRARKKEEESGTTRKQRQRSPNKK
jgi:hypothetical protein